MRISSHYVRFFLPVVLWAGVIFAFSSFPTGTATEIKWQDFVIKKSAHVIEYAILSVLLYRAFVNIGIAKGKALVLAVIISSLYGMTDEFHQSFTPGREPHFRDVIFDTIGASAAALIIWKVLPIAPVKLRKLAENYQLI